MPLKMFIEFRLKKKKVVKSDKYTYYIYKDIKIKINNENKKNHRRGRAYYHC